MGIAVAIRPTRCARMRPQSFCSKRPFANSTKSWRVAQNRLRPRYRTAAPIQPKPRLRRHRPRLPMAGSPRAFLSLRSEPEWRIEYANEYRNEYAQWASQWLFE